MLLLCTFEIRQRDCTQLLGNSAQNKACHSCHDLELPILICEVFFSLAAYIALDFIFAAFSLTRRLDEESPMSPAEHLTTSCDEKLF